MIKVACDYNIKEDIGFILESEKINNIEFAERAKVSRTTLEGIVKKGIARDDVCEKIYAYAYNNKYRINSVKEELIKEKYKKVNYYKYTGEDFSSLVNDIEIMKNNINYALNLFDKEQLKELCLRCIYPLSENNRYIGINIDMENSFDKEDDDYER